MEFLGCVNADWQVEDEESEPIGQIDPGRALVNFIGITVFLFFFNEFYSYEIILVPLLLNLIIQDA